MIPFNRPTQTGSEQAFVTEALNQNLLSGNGTFTQRCEQWFEASFAHTQSRALLTSSCTHALEMAAILLDIKEGDEVIMPSFTFPSTANAFVLRGARIVFVDIEPSTMNMCIDAASEAITAKTKAIVAVHYAGVACDMAALMALANQHNIVVVEDAAQGMLASFNGKPLGTMGHIGAYSFHATKNFTSGGEGGLLIVNEPQLQQRAYWLRESGTNRRDFMQGKVDKYSWVDKGSSYLVSELNAAYLWGNLQHAETISQQRLALWELYFKKLSPLMALGKFELPTVPAGCQHNGHIFYIKLNNPQERQALQEHLAAHHIETATHYVPLHSSQAGQRYGHFHGEDRYTTQESQRLLRLPLFYGLAVEQVERVCVILEQNFATE